MNDIVKQANAGLPANFGDSLMKGIEDTRAHISTTGIGGIDLLRILRTGVWVFGQNNEVVQDGSRWAVNVATLERGWCCWDDGHLQGQVMASIQTPRPAQPAPINGAAFVEQFSLELTCIDGEDAGQLVLYRNNSSGFKEAFGDLIAAIRNRYAVDPVHYWPIVTLQKTFYDHKKYGQIFKPIFHIVAWADAEGIFAGQPEAKPAPQAAPAKPAKPALAAVETTTDPVSTTQAHVGQRRRPVNR